MLNLDTFPCIEAVKLQQHLFSLKNNKHVTMDKGDREAALFLYPPISTTTAQATATRFSKAILYAMAP